MLLLHVLPVIRDNNIINELYVISIIFNCFYINITLKYI